MNDDFSKIDEFKKEEKVATIPELEDEKREFADGEMYRYQCPACTGIAFYTDNPTGSNPSTCRNCGASINNRNEDSFIALTENEREQLEALK